MSQTPQPQQSAKPPRIRRRRRKIPWYRNVATLIGVLGLIIAVFAIIFNFPRIQHSLGLDNPTIGTPSSSVQPIPTATAFPTTSPVGIPLQLISQPNYANVGGTLVSNSLSGQNIELRLSYVNNGKAACIGVKFHTLDLYIIKSSEPPLKPKSSINQSWTLLPGVPELQRVQFQIPPGAGSQYTLTLHLDVGGCAAPHDSSPNRYANYQVKFSVTE